ncbi:MAG TPA: 3-deoxy-D-manno-octulosonic acid transferase [Ramlibacter sp.]|nr:3-deoxy-D-manno-octulosonic acid transferase [Ramlibacter sp.]
MIRPLYSLVLIGAQPFLRRKLKRRGAAEPGYLHAVDERFGRYRTPAEPGALWIHAVSLGETRAAAILLARLRERDPGLRVLLTHGTATGWAEGERLLRPGDHQAWLPWDTPRAVRRFLGHFQPSAGVLMETEVWPNLVADCRARHVPLVLANARLSAKSLAQARRLRHLSRPAYGGLTAVWAQTQADAQRLREAGANVQGVFGNLKFDATPDAALVERGRAWRARHGRPVVMFASSREGEEARLLEAIRAQPPADVQWLLVPRHPQRFDEVTALVHSRGFSVSRRSRWTSAPLPADVWVGDSLGEMPLYYALAGAALLGGSFEPLGGQNLIEAAACGCPLVMGPHTFNFAEAAQLAQHSGAALGVTSIEEGVQAAVAIARDALRRDAMSTAGLAFAAAHRGAADRTADAVLAVIASSSRLGR